MPGVLLCSSVPGAQKYPYTEYPEFQSRTEIMYMVNHAGRFRRAPLFAFLLAAGMLLLAAGGVRHAQAQQPQVITFDEAIRIALDRNIQVKQSGNNIELSARQVFQRRMDFLPSFSMSTNGSRGSGFAQDQAGRNIQFTSQNLNGSLSGQINLFDGFANIAALRQSRHNLQASELTYDQTRETVAFDVASNFLLYVNGGQLVVIQQENLEAQRQLLAQIEEFVNVGSRPISDLYQQQAATAQSELDVLNAERDAELSKARLIQGLQLDPRGEYEFVAPRYEDVPVIPQDYNLQELFDIAFRSRDDLAAQEARILAAQQGVRLAKSVFWPRVDLGGSYRSNYSPDDFMDRSFFDQLDGNRGNSLGFNISYSLFDGFSRNTQVQQAEVQYRNEMLEMESLKQNAALQVRQGYLEYETARKSLEVSETQVLAAERALDASQNRYNVGAGTLVELTQARAQYVTAVSNRVQAQYNFLFQSKLVDFFVGRLDLSAPLFD